MKGIREKWNRSSLYNDDPTGGENPESGMVRKAGHYYVTKEDIALIKWAVRQIQVMDAFSHIETLVELSPGSEEIILQKTIPFSKSINTLKSYVALDISKGFAEKTANLATKSSKCVTWVARTAGFNDCQIVVYGNMAMLIARA